MRTTNILYKLSVLLLVLVLIVPILAACGDDDDENIPANSPVKIGAIAPWSGNMAVSGSMGDEIIKLVEKQVQDQGGILGGRPVEFVRYDNRASVPEAVAGARKLLFEDNVAALIWGGVTTVEFSAVSTFAKENKVLYVPYGEPENLETDIYTVNAMLPSTDMIDVFVSVSNKLIKPKKLAFLGRDATDIRARFEAVKQQTSTAGTDTIYEEYVIPETVDFTPYLTKIKYAEPDLLILDQMNEGYKNIAKQVTELGGLGDIKVLATSPASSALGQAGIEGWYIRSAWISENPYPGTTKFLNDYQAMFNKSPNTNLPYYYNAAWTAIYAIELAGTDTDQLKIAEAARSGNLTWETPMGTAHFTSDGQSNLHSMVTQVQEGELVAITIPD